MITDISKDQNKLSGSVDLNEGSQSKHDDDDSNM